MLSLVEYFSYVSLFFQVDLVRGQLKRATERYGGPLTSNVLSRALSQPLDKEVDPLQSGNRVIGSLHVENIGNIDHEVKAKSRSIPKGNTSEGYGPDRMIHRLETMRSSSSEVRLLDSTINPESRDNSTIKSSNENKKNDSPVIPEDFLCPISLELMRDPVIVATGQVRFAGCRFHFALLSLFIDGPIFCFLPSNRVHNHIDCADL